MKRTKRHLSMFPSEVDSYIRTLAVMRDICIQHLSNLTPTGDDYREVSQFKNLIDKHQAHWTGIEDYFVPPLRVSYDAKNEN